MVDQKQTCGTTPITYPPECTYVCVCSPRFGCTWSVQCGGFTTTGQGLATDAGPVGGHEPHASVHGDLAVIAELLAKGWKRTVKVPESLRGKVIKRKRTLAGTPEEIAKALGLEIAPKRGGSPHTRPARTG